MAIPIGIFTFATLLYFQSARMSSRLEMICPLRPLSQSLRLCQLPQRGSQGPDRNVLPLPLGEVSPKGTERARPLRQNLSAVPALALFFCVEICYTETAALLHSILWGEEVRHMHDILSFLLSVAAGVVANYIYKWLDERDKDSKH